VRGSHYCGFILGDLDDGVHAGGGVDWKGWDMLQRRGALTRWLDDAVEDGKPQWTGKTPAVCSLNGIGKRAGEDVYIVCLS